MTTAKREALGRYERAFKAYEDGLISRGEKERVKDEILEVDGISIHHLRSIEEKIRDKIVRNR